MPNNARVFSVFPHLNLWVVFGLRAILGLGRRRLRLLIWFLCSHEEVVGCDSPQADADVDGTLKRPVTAPVTFRNVPTHRVSQHSRQNCPDEFGKLYGQVGYDSRLSVCQVFPFHESDLEDRASGAFRTIVRSIIVQFQGYSPV
jgi:hypothetical protein